jgi:hypothetical protein
MGILQSKRIQNYLEQNGCEPYPVGGKTPEMLTPGQRRRLRHKGNKLMKQLGWTAVFEQKLKDGTAYTEGFTAEEVTRPS